MNNEELRQVRDTLIEALRASDILTLEGRALFRRYEAKSNEAMAAAAAGPAIPGPDPQAGPGEPPVPATRRRTDEEDEEFGGSFMVRDNPSQPTIPGYRETPPVDPDLPRSMRDRRR
jgi:hypothetical protein